MHRPHALVLQAAHLPLLGAQQPWSMGVASLTPSTFPFQEPLVALGAGMRSTLPDGRSEEANSMTDEEEIPGPKPSTGLSLVAWHQSARETMW